MARLTKSEILSLTPQQIEQMKRHNLTQLKRITSDLQAINKKSYTRMSSRGIHSQFISTFEKSGGVHSIRGMTAQQVKAEFESQLSMVKAQTRTMKGANKVYKEMAKKIDPSGTRLPESMLQLNKDQVSSFWDVYHKFSEMHPTESGAGTGGSPPEAVSEMIWNNIDDGGSVDDILERVNREYEDWYRQKEMKDETDYISNPFTIPGTNR